MEDDRAREGARRSVRDRPSNRINPENLAGRGILPQVADSLVTLTVLANSFLPRALGSYSSRTKSTVCFFRPELSAST